MEKKILKVDVAQLKVRGIFNTKSFILALESIVKMIPEKFRESSEIEFIDFDCEEIVATIMYYEEIEIH
jgi:hypothetical protein